MPDIINAASLFAAADAARNPGVWDEGVGLCSTSSMLCEHVAADCVVVGGGITGVSAAFHLAQLGASVRLLEAGDIGSGAVGRSSGFVNPGLWASPSVVLRILGTERGELLLQLLGDAPKVVFDLVNGLSIACDLQQVGTLHCANSEAGLADIRSRADEWASRGADLQLLGAAEAAALTGTRKFLGAILDRRGGTLNPMAYVSGLARAAIRASAQVHCLSPALTLNKRGNCWQVSTPLGSVTAPWVLVATDSYSDGAWRALGEEQVCLPYFNIATKPLDAVTRRLVLPASIGFVDTNRVMNAVRLDGRGRLILGSVGALRGASAWIHRRWAVRHLRNLFAGLGNVEIESQSWGMIGLTNDHMPCFHELAPQVLTIGGYNGRGLAAGTVFGRLMARAISNASSTDIPLPRSAVRRASFRWLKSAFYELGAAVAHI